MKAFLEEYGLIVVVCIAFAVLIALVVWATGKGSDSSTSTINGFTDKATSIMNDNGVQPGDSASITSHAFVDSKNNSTGANGADGKCDACGNIQTNTIHNVSTSTPAPSGSN